MIFSEIYNALTPPPAPQVAVPQRMMPETLSGWGTKTKSKQVVSEETSKKIATAYRCANVLSDDIATMPFQTYTNINDEIKRVQELIQTLETRKQTIGQIYASSSEMIGLENDLDVTPAIKDGGEDSAEDLGVGEIDL